MLSAVAHFLSASGGLYQFWLRLNDLDFNGNYLNPLRENALSGDRVNCAGLITLGQFDVFKVPESEKSALNMTT
ncbi:hypothetical protein C7W93_20020 [Glaciimonas sp. PCH181]|nr:hypothetical protein C7W93_20020 [Glaciimonas sp. PCH181]